MAFDHLLDSMTRQFASGDQHAPIFTGGKCRRCNDWRTGQEFEPGHIWCTRCENELAALADHELFASHMPDFFKRMLAAHRGSRTRARLQNAELEAVELLEIFLTQQARCALTGWQMEARLNAGPLQATLLRRGPGKLMASNIMLVAQVVARAAAGSHAEDLQKLAHAIEKYSVERREMALLADISGGA